MISDMIIIYNLIITLSLARGKHTHYLAYILSQFTFMGQVFAQQRMQSRHMQHTIDQKALQFPW